MARPLHSQVVRWETQMETNNLKALMITGLTIVMIGFQNFQLMPEDLMGLKPVDETQRVKHARELLGSRHFDRSAASQKGQLSNIHFKLYQEVLDQLPKIHKGHAYRITRTILNESSKYNFDPIFVAAIIKTESSYNPLAKGGVGEIGLMQLRPETAMWIATKMKISYFNHNDLKDPVKNIELGVAYMDYLRSKFESKSYRYIAAYNMGPKNVRRLISQSKKPKVYSKKIFTNYLATYKRIVGQTLITDTLISVIADANLDAY